MGADSFAKEFLDKASIEGRRRSLRPVRRVSPRECEVEGMRCVDFSSNDYLGLSMREELKDAAARWMARHGCGSGASRLVSGTSDECLELEARIAKWKGFEAALIVGSGYAANMGALEALCHQTGGVIFADKLNHASMNQGCILSGAEFKRYRHSDMKHLNSLAETHGTNAGVRLVASGTVFSMDGDIAPIQDLKGVADTCGAMLYLDDAHGTGVFGERGEGLASPQSCDIALCTFSKAMGSYGACILCSSEMKEYLVNRCMPFIFSTALPPPVMGAIDAAVSLLQTDELAKARTHLRGLSSMLRDGLKVAGFDIGASESMIVPVIVGGAEETMTLSRKLLEKGVFTLAIRPPSVPEGKSRLRVSVNASHTEDDISRLISALAPLCF